MEKENEAPSVRYVLHKDHSSDKWNVFKKIGFYEEFIDSFTELSAAQDFCDINNGVERRSERQIMNSQNILTSLFVLAIALYALLVDGLAKKDS